MPSKYTLFLKIKWPIKSAASIKIILIVFSFLVLKSFFFFFFFNQVLKSLRHWLSRIWIEESIKFVLIPNFGIFVRYFRLLVFLHLFLFFFLFWVGEDKGSNPESWPSHRIWDMKVSLDLFAICDIDQDLLLSNTATTSLPP